MVFPAGGPWVGNRASAACCWRYASWWQGQPNYEAQQCLPRLNLCVLLIHGAGPALLAVPRQSHDCLPRLQRQRPEGPVWLCCRLRWPTTHRPAAAHFPSSHFPIGPSCTLYCVPRMPSVPCPSLQCSHADVPSMQRPTHIGSSKNCSCLSILRKFASEDVSASFHRGIARYATGCAGVLRCAALRGVCTPLSHLAWSEQSDFEH